jgi:hypothetical protein
LSTNEDIDSSGRKLKKKSSMKDRKKINAEDAQIQYHFKKLFKLPVKQILRIQKLTINQLEQVLSLKYKSKLAKRILLVIFDFDIDEINDDVFIRNQLHSKGQILFGNQG